MYSKNSIHNHNDYLDLLRFTASILIMCSHLFYIGLPWGTYPFCNAWVYVEFFFILTGCFTARHFSLIQDTDNNLTSRVMSVMTYTVKKFVRFIPYSMVIVPVACLIRNWDYFQQVKWSVIMVFFSAGTLALFNMVLKVVCVPFIEMVLEIFFLSESTLTFISSGTLWYLCAMLSVFPVFVFLLQLKRKQVVLGITLTLGTAYYVIFGVSGLRGFYHDLLRAFSGLCLGAAVYFLSCLIKEINTSKKVDMCLTVYEIAAFTFTVLINAFNKTKYFSAVMIAFITTGIIIFSGKSYTQKIQCRFFRWLGRLSLPIFMWQWTWESFMNLTMVDYSSEKKVIIYFAGTFVLAIVHMTTVDVIGSQIKKKKNQP